MEQREVLVTLISATDLKKVAAFGKMSVYCVAWIHPNMKVSSPVDKKGNSDPTWNATLKLVADERLVEDGNAVLVIDLYDHGTFGTNNVGSCTIPLSGLKAPAKTEKEGKEGKEGGGSSSSPNYKSVPVMRKSGNAKGTLNLSIRLGELLKRPDPQVAAPSPSFPQQQAMPGYENKDFEGAPAYAYPAGYPPAYGQQGYAPPVAAAQPYPMYQQAPYAGQQAPYPGQQAPYPGQQVPYPGQQAPYPGQQAPYYPAQQAPYPGQMPPPYYAPGGYAAPPPQQQQQQRRQGGFLGGGMGGLGAGLAGGALGGLLLGSALDGGGDGGDGGGDGGGCGGGDGGGGCGGGGCGG